MRQIGFVALAVVFMVLFFAANNANSGAIQTISETAPITVSAGANPTVGLTILTTGTDGDSSTTTGDSGLETVNSSLSLYRGCADGELLKWTESTDAWDCSADSGGGGGGSFTTQLGDVTTVASTTVIDFSADHFAVTESPSGEANVSISIDSEALLEASVTGVTDIFTNNDGALADDDVTDDTLTSLSDVDLTGDTSGSVLIRNAGDTAYNDHVFSGDGTLSSTGVLEVTEADAFETDPTDCGANTFADAIAANGDLTCNAVTTDDITDDNLLEADLDAVDTAADEECLTYESGAGGDFEWQTCGGASQNLFETINAPSGTDPVADSTTDTLNLATSTGITITGDSGTDTITIGIDLVDDADGVSATTASESGLEFLAGELGLIRGCSNGELLKFTAASQDWNCSADSTGGSPSFDTIASGTNTTAAMVIGNGATLTLNVGAENEATSLFNAVNNNSGATLFQCTPVYISGFDAPSGLPTVAIADADNAAAMPAMGLVTADIANGADGFVVVAGQLDAIDTATPESWSVGDRIYVNDSGTATSSDCGQALTNVRPANTDDNIQTMATVERVNATAGRLKIIGAGRQNDVPNLADDSVWVGSSTNVATATAIGDCDASTDHDLQYDITTNSFSCDSTADDDQPDSDAEVPDAITIAGGTIGTSAITLVQSAAPTPTAEGRIEWETDDDHIIVGDGAAQVEFVPAEDVSGDITMTDAGVTTIQAGAVDISTDTNLTAGRSLTLTGDDVAADTELYTDTKGIWFEFPTAIDDFESIWTANGFAATITKIWCESDQTVNMDLQVDDGTPADVNGTDLVCDSTPAEDEAMGGDATLADGDRLDLAITSVSGSPTWVSIQWTFTYDD